MRGIAYFRSVFDLDLRSLALFRVALGSVSLIDLWHRWPDAAAFISDEGFLSRSDLIEHIDRPWAISFHLVWGLPLQMQILLALHAVIIVAMMVGWNTRAFTIAAWVFTSSLINRNPLMVNGGDTLLSMLYFWSMFLPLGARYSIDAWNAARRGGPVAKLENAWRDTASAGLILQLAILYWTTVALKTDPVWWTGEALHRVFHNDLILKPRAYLIRDYGAVLVGLTWFTVTIEALGPFLLFIPWRRDGWRLVAILGFLGLHTGIFLFMEVELFSYACGAAWLALLPPLVWEPSRWPRFARRWVRGSADASTATAQRRPAPALGPVARWINVVALVLIVFWISRQFMPGELRGKITHDLIGPMRMVQLRQSWQMFTPAPRSSDGWFVLRGRQANGEIVDLLRDGAPFTWDKPACASCTYPTRRWVEYIHRVGISRNRRLRPSFGNYFIREWNARHDVGYQVVEVEFYYLREEITPEGDGPPERRRIWHRDNIPPTLD